MNSKIIFFNICWSSRSFDAPLDIKTVIQMYKVFVIFQRHFTIFTKKSKKMAKYQSSCTRCQMICHNFDRWNNKFYSLLHTCDAINRYYKVRNRFPGHQFPYPRKWPNDCSQTIIRRSWWNSFPQNIKNRAIRSEELQTKWNDMNFVFNTLLQARGEFGQVPI